MKKLDRLILEISNKQYKINNTKSLEYARQYRREKIELEKKLFQLLAETKENMSKNEVEIFMAKITPSIIDSMRSLGEWEGYTMPKDLERVYKGVYLETSDLIASGVKGKIDFYMIHPTMVETVVNTPIKGELFSDRIWNNKVKLANRVYEDINQAIKEGTDIRKLSKLLSKDFDTGTYEAMRLLQNETTRVINQAQEEIYRQSGVVDEVGFVATLDNLTSDICQGLDGTSYSVDDPSKPNIPDDTHVNCRSTYIPMVKGWSPTTRRDNLEKKEIDYVDYKEWII